MRHTLLLLFVIGLSTSCHTARKNTRQEVLLDTLHVSAKDNPHELYRESAPRSWELVHTRVALQFNLKEQTASGTAWLRLHPYAYPADSLVLDAKSIRLSGQVQYTGPGTLRRQAVHGDSIILYFDRALTPRDTIMLSMSYTAMPYSTDGGGSAAIRDSRGLYFINTDGAVPGKPVQIWTQGETEANSHWVPTIDHPNARSAFRIELTVPDSFRTLSNGALVESSRQGAMRTDIWEIKERIAVYTAMFAIGNFSVVKDDAWQGREVSYYVEPAYAPYARLIFRHTPEMIDFYSRVTGMPYPWHKYSQVVVRDYVSGAMENTTASLFGEFMNQDAREIADGSHENIVAHELFHQWFGDYVTAESWSHLTLNESFANYGEYLWWRYKHGAAAADEYHFSDLSRYLSAAALSDPPLVRFHYADHEDMFDRVSYQKGGRILHYLHQLAGDTAFFRAMRLYLTRHALSPAETADWRLAVEETTGQDWNWFFNQWYYRGGHPVLDIAYQYDDAAGRLTVTVTQRNSDSSFAYRLPLKTALVYGDEQQLTDWDIRRREETFIYPYKNGHRPVVVPDITHLLPGEIREQKQPAQWLAQYRVCGDYISRRRAIAHAYAQPGDSSTRVLFRLALRDTIPAIRSYTLSRLEQLERGRSEWQQQVASMAVLDGNNLVRTAAFDVLGAWRVSSSIPDMLAALADSSYNVSGAALAALAAVAPDTAYARAKQLWYMQPRARLQQEIWMIAGRQGNDADVLLFEKDIAHLSGARKLQLAAGLSELLKRAGQDTLFEKGLTMLTEMTITENIRTYRQGLGEFIFNLGKAYKGQAVSGDRAARRQLIRSYAQMVMDAEQHPALRKKFSDLAREW